LAPVSEAYLRNLVRECGLPLDPLVEGVRQDTFENLSRTLVALAVEYERAAAAGNHTRAAACRRAVLTAKDHARLAVRRPGVTAAQTAMKREMVEWMLLWLENPALFPGWVAIRTKLQAGSGSGPANPA